jgi:hypothetical protein
MWLGMRTQTVDAATGRGEDATEAHCLIRRGDPCSLCV